MELLYNLTSDQFTCLFYKDSVTTKPRVNVKEVLKSNFVEK